MKTRIAAQLLVATWWTLHCGLLQGATLPMRSLEPPVLLPDGTEFKTWEQPTRFDRTYYVDRAHPNASDANPGTSERPFATINRAAQVLQPGERRSWRLAFIASGCGPRVEGPGPTA